MVSQASCFNTGDGGRRYNRPYPPPPPSYMGYHDRSRFHPSSHDGQSQVAMTDSQLDLDSPQQRKRIAVACGRCRKRKIRCSGDMGQGQPCQNCKNAGADQCLFLRVSSREAPFLPSDASPSADHHFNYSVSDARVLASRNGSMSMPTYPQPSPEDVLPYRPQQPYTPTPTTAAAAYGKYYPLHPYTAGPGTTDDFDFLPSQPVDPMPMPMLQPNWRPATTKPYAPPLYLDPPSYPYANLVHRPAPEYTDPSPNTRLLPDPARSYSTSKPPSGSPGGVNALAEAANYVSAYDGSGLSYTGSTTNKEGYGGTTGTGGESLFGEQERNLQSQGGGL